MNHHPPKERIHRFPMIDAFKAVASQLIVLHHLAAYGPVSDAVQPICDHAECRARPAARCHAAADDVGVGPSVGRDRLRTVAAGDRLLPAPIDLLDLSHGEDRAPRRQRVLSDILVANAVDESRRLYKARRHARRSQRHCRRACAA